MQPIAFLREVTESFARCVTRIPAVPPLDPGLARRQHRGYRDALEAGGYEVVVVPGDEAHPDGCFIEDAAAVIGDTALMARSGHPSRRGEVGPVAEALAGYFAVEHLDDGTLDGGDVLQMGRTVFVGTGGRTDPAGARRLATLAARAGKRLVEVTVRDALHLKSGVTAIDDDTVLWHPAACDRETFDGMRVVEVEGTDPEAANVVRLADGTILVGVGRDAVADQIVSLGYQVIACDTSEFARADGGLTCLSIRVR
ncbi:MAG: arginine deiminase family protein [Acidimicrobiia bacterium]